MREILFKAKRFTTGEWVQGCYDNVLGIPAINVIDEEKNKYTHIRIDRETICQFTGKYDKNHNPIFENDILQIELEDDDGSKNIEKMYIGWDEKECQFRTMSFDDVEECGWFDERYEVIGNISDK